MLNRFVLQQSDSLVNLTTKKSLPKNSTEKVLKENYFLEGQEQDSIDYFLFGKPKTSFSIDIIPTWECNLRCNHCFVLHELLKSDKRDIDKEMLAGFVRRLATEYPSITNGTVQFIGGEPTLRSRKNIDLIRAMKEIQGIRIKFSGTSNGTLCDDEAMEFFSALDSFIISLDGPELTHNLQRKSIAGDSNPFKTTVRTIEKLVEAGMRDKMIVQASLNEECMTKSNLIEFYKVLLMCGVKFDNILAGFVCPTKHNPKLDDEFIEIHRVNVRNKPCCKYRHMVNFVVDNSNNVFCDYFEANGKNLLGRLSDPISKMAENHERIIRSSYSVLNDPKCKQCPVIGLCWGWCANTKGLNPSDHCDQAMLIEKARRNAEQNNLTNLMKDSRKHDITRN